MAKVVQNSAIWRDDPHVLKLFLYLIMKARFDKEPKKYPGFELKRGEVLTSLSQIADDNEYFKHTVKKWSRAKVSRMLEKLQDQGYIKLLSDTFGTHLKVSNYDTYQSPELYVSDSNETIVKQLCNSSETVVNISNKDKETIRKINNDKEINIKFENWWNLYDKKRNKKYCQNYWERKMNDDERLEAYHHTTDYVKHTEKVYRKDPERYLRNKAYQDEIIIKSGNQSKLKTSDILKERYRLALLEDQENEEK